MKHCRIRRLVLLSLALLMLLSSGGCSQAADKQRSFRNEEIGILFTIPEALFACGLGEPEIYASPDNYSVFELYYYNKEITDPLIEEYERVEKEEPQQFTEDFQIQIIEEYVKHRHLVLLGGTVPEEDFDAFYTDDVKAAGYEVLGRQNGLVYIASIQKEELSGLELSDEELRQYETCMEQAEYIRDHIKLIPPSVKTAVFPDKFPDFTAETIDGERVSNAVFAEKALTVINIWGTYCSPCIDEMPELAQWAQEMPDTVQLMGIILDVTHPNDRNAPLAQEILEESGADCFKNLLAGPEISDTIANVTAVPTTFFVDREGNILKELVVGADVARYKMVVEDYLHEKNL